MGGLRAKLPLAFWASLAGAGALAGVPLMTSGFFSKEWILEAVWSSPLGGPWLWLGGAVGALLTGLYSFRLIFRVFFGAVATVPHERSSPALAVPLAVLAGLAVTVGWLQWPRDLGGVQLFEGFLSSSLPALHAADGPSGIATAAVSALSLLGIALAALLYLPTPRPVDWVTRFDAVRALGRLWQDGWRFDRLYEWIVLRPWYAITGNPRDRIDRLYGLVAELMTQLHLLLSRTQTGELRWYAASVALGALVLIGWIAL